MQKRSFSINPVSSNLIYLLLIRFDQKRVFIKKGRMDLLCATTNWRKINRAIYLRTICLGASGVLQVSFLWLSFYGAAFFNFLPESSSGEREEVWGIEKIGKFLISILHECVSRFMEALSFQKTSMSLNVSDVFAY